MTTTADMSGSTILITGANGGIGRETALALARTGASLILTVRDPAASTSRAVEQEVMAAATSGTVTLVPLDLADLRSVRDSAETITRAAPVIDTIINNAGAAFTARELTPQGIERTFAVNYVGHYALTRLLLQNLRRGSSRVITVSSVGHKLVRGMRWDDLTFTRGYGAATAYGQAKLAEILFTRELASRCGSIGVHAHAVHPGFVNSSFYDDTGIAARALQTFVRLTAKTPKRGAATSVHLATSDDALRSNGGYWADSKPAKPSAAARSSADAERLWTLTEALITSTGVVTDLPSPPQQA